MKCLVTGGAGFIGSHVTDALLKKGYEVVVLDDLSGGFKENVNSKSKLIECSITDYQRIDSLFKQESFDYVFHFAAYAAEGLSHFIKRFNYENNLIGSINLINASINYKIKNFVFTSSIAVYGAGQTPLTEEMEPAPEDSYGIAKLSIEKELEISKRMFDLNYIIFRPHNVYGHRQNIGDKYRNVIGIFMNQLMQGKPMTIFGDGLQTRAFTHISDIAPIIADSIEVQKSWNTIYNIGADVPYSVKALAEEVASAMGVPPVIEFLDYRNEVVHAFSDHSKVKKVFNIQSSVTLKEGLSSMAQWVKKEGVKSSKPFKNIEVIKNLPKSWR